MHRTTCRTLTPRLALCAILAALVISACGDDGATRTTGTTPAAEQTVGAVQTSGATSPAGVTLVDPAEGSEILAAEMAITIIDVRTPAEFAAGHLADARNVDVNGATFADDISALDKNATYFVYCHSGRRSAIATQAMSDKGFTHIYELDGGIQAWVSAGQPTVAS